MQEQVTSTGIRMLILNTVAFTICFAAWMLNGVLVTFLADNHIFDWDPVETGWLIGLPVLSGAVLRLPIGMITDKFGGKWVYGGVLLLCAIPMFLLSRVSSFWGFALCSFGFGLAGSSFAVGIAYTSVWFPKKWQGTALGIFGAGNSGAAITTFFAPTLLRNFTENGSYLEGWRMLPMVYAIGLLVMGVLFILFTKNKKSSVRARTIAGSLKPLKMTSVWRFGLFYFLVFGCFVAFSQWLVPYFVNVYSKPLITAGIFAALFSLPSGAVRALGGWIADKVSPQKLLYWIIGLSIFISLLLLVPKMEVLTPGQGIMAVESGKVSEVSTGLIKVNDRTYKLLSRDSTNQFTDNKMVFWPKKEVWQESLVKVGDQVAKKQLLARGISRIYFQANFLIYAILVIIIGSIWGVGSATVYKLIPLQFPEEIGVVGGMVGMLGALGGFFGPILFGYLLKGTGLWTSSWMFVFALSIICFLWLFIKDRHILKRNLSQSDLPTR
jgi:NNP family nitrate/nitrite transporter-like MFS transporter